MEQPIPDLSARPRAGTFDGLGPPPPFDRLVRAGASARLDASAATDPLLAPQAPAVARHDAPNLPDLPPSAPKFPPSARPLPGPGDFPPTGAKCGWSPPASRSAGAGETISTSSCRAQRGPWPLAEAGGEADGDAVAAQAAGGFSVSKGSAVAISMESIGASTHAAAAAAEAEAVAARCIEARAIAAR